MMTLKKRIKTEFEGRVWLHEKYLKEIKKGNKLILTNSIPDHEHKGHDMTITSLEDLDVLKGLGRHTERYGPNRGQKYSLYGFKFKPDGWAEDSLFA
jgi:hypothetical protein